MSSWPPQSKQQVHQEDIEQGHATSQLSFMAGSQADRAITT